MANEGYFPSDKYEALAFLYVQSRDLSKTTPEDLAAMYVEAYTKIRSQMIDTTWFKEKQN